ncbi:MAG: hypothetical protein F6K58_30185, partial [Symploca sp. SIO2E9]|nr:hypothetical protein [Symploca sp. SIO2E9]
MGRWGDGEMGRWGDGEMGRWGDGEIGVFYFDELFACPAINPHRCLGIGTPVSSLN